jgi:phosphoribosylformimino-5-aminoimidazole carboxamide ribotide isomerase
MILFPAIDLKDGQCVRLLHGDMNEVTVFSDSPGAQARAFTDAGCEYLHVVDLNGAFEGRPVNGEAVDAILAAVDVPVQLGGGIRNLETIEYWLNRGIARVILGTVALRKPELVVTACANFPNQIAVGIDARGGKVAIEGWADTSEVTALDLAENYEHTGVAAIIYTDIERDGAMQGPNIEATRTLAQKTAIPIIASGGVSSMDDLQNLRDGIPNLAGIITGRAVYDGKIDLAQGVTMLKETPC